MPNFTDAILQATTQLMEQDGRIHVLGLGASYDNGLDGTANGLAKRFPGRVWDTPCSEAAITNMAVGMSATGLRPIAHHGRIEFSLLALDAILTQAANWSFMFGGNYPCPLTVRVCIGRQWGNGPQHTRVSRALFAVPGLRVVVPSTPEMASGLLLSAVRDNNPVIYLEHRWLYKLQGTVSGEPIPLDKARVMRTGKDITIVAIGDMVLEALLAAQLLAKCGVSAEVVDIVSAFPVDYDTVIGSASKTKHVLIVDSGNLEYGVAAGIWGPIAQMCIGAIMTTKPYPCPTATNLTGAYYPTAANIVDHAASILDLDSLLHASRILLPERTFDELHLPPKIDVDRL